MVLHRTGKNLKSTIINKLEASESTVQSLGRSVGSVEAWVISSAIMTEWHLTFWNASGEDVGSALNNGQPDTRCVSHSITFPGKPPKVPRKGQVWLPRMPLYKSYFLF